MRKTGRIKAWMKGKSYGFIKQDEGKDLFCHISAFQEYITEQIEEFLTDTRVEYLVELGEDGRKVAVDIKLIQEG